MRDRTWAHSHSRPGVLPGAEPAHARLLAWHAEVSRAIFEAEAGRAGLATRVVGGWRAADVVSRAGSVPLPRQLIDLSGGPH